MRGRAQRGAARVGVVAAATVAFGGLLALALRAFGGASVAFAFAVVWLPMTWLGTAAWAAIVLEYIVKIIAIGVVYNNMRVTLSMRARDLATMRVLGFTRREVGSVLFGGRWDSVLTFAWGLPTPSGAGGPRFSAGFGTGF